MMTLLAAPLTACAGAQTQQADALVQQVRSAYLEMTGCSAELELCADYGERVFTYGMNLAWEKEGELTLTLTAPENVAGASARVARGETALEYEGVMVETGPLDAGGLSPIDAVPALLAYAREGFISECVLEELDGAQCVHITCRDPESAPGAGREGQLWFDRESFALVRGEIAADGATVIQCRVENFVMEPERPA